MLEREDSFGFGSKSSDCRKSNNRNRRLIRKNGKSEMSIIDFPKIESLYGKRSDIVHTLIDAKWKWTLSILIMTFIFTWFLFALLWMAIGVASEDEEEFLSAQCLIGIGNFSGYLLFSIETQTSVGYGSRSITQNCYEAIVLVCLQILIGIVLGGSMVSIVYAKMISPKTQHADRCFSKNAVICQRDGKLCLIFRTRDPSKKYEFRTTIKAFLIKMRENESIMKSIELESTGLIIWPTEIIHRIKETSPFWNLSARDLVSKRFEIVVIMEGTSLSTNQSSRTITSYLSNEILWGYIFKSCVKFDVSKKCYRVSHKRFNATKEIPTPLCSARQLSEIYSNVFFRGSYSVSSPESGIAISPHISTESSEFSTDVDNSDSDDEEKKISKFQLRKRSSIIMSNLLDSLQKYVHNDIKKSEKIPLETAL